MPTVKEKEIREMLPVEQLERMLPNIAWNYWVELNKLRNEAVQALHLHATIAERTGLHINVGERFKVEFTLWLGPIPNCPTEEMGLPLYRNVTATIKGTTFAKPVAGTVRVARAGVEATSGWSVDATTGIVTFATAPAAGVLVTAGFEFDVPVRFDTDRLDVTWDLDRLGSIASIPLVEVRR